MLPHVQRIAVTGSSGYLGRRLVSHIRAVDPAVTILGLDVAPSRDCHPHEFAEVDVRSPKLKQVLDAFRPDTVVHLAFIVNPLHDESLMRDINVNGSRNVLTAAGQIGAKRCLVASSATAFGAWPDNPVPLDDHSALRGRTEFSYSADKAELESMLGDFENQHPQMAVSWIRPCIIYGPGVDNYLSRLLLKPPMVVLPDGCDLPQQFVHEDDVAAATWWIVSRNGRGPYNVGPPDWIHLTDVARETGRRTISIPFWLMKMVSRICWGLHLPVLRYPPGVNFYIRYPWVVAPRRLCDELGFRFRFSTLETLRAVLRAHGRLPDGAGVPALRMGADAAQPDCEPKPFADGASRPRKRSA